MYLMQIPLDATPLFNVQDAIGLGLIIFGVILLTIITASWNDDRTRGK